MPTATPINRDRISEAARMVRPHIRRTPVIEVDGGDFGLRDVTIVLKLELLQHSGSFKARGAFANLLLRNIPAAGVAAASGGNHGAAVAYAAHRLGRRAAIFVPEISSPAKIARIRRWDADLVISGARYADALAACEAHIARTGACGVHAYDAEETILGAASLAMELEEQAGAVDAILVSVGGGGLIAGVASWAHEATAVIAVESEGCPALHRALAAGAPVDAPTEGRAADSLGARRVGVLPFEIARARVAQSLLVSDAAILDAQKALWEKVQIAAEPGAAAAFAALLSGAYRPAPGARIAVIICGGNTNAVDFDR